MSTPRDRSHESRERKARRGFENREGLTFPEWFEAATAFGHDLSKKVALRAWMAGNDPTEWANYLFEGGKV